MLGFCFIQMLDYCVTTGRLVTQSFFNPLLGEQWYMEAGTECQNPFDSVLVLRLGRKKSIPTFVE